MPLAKIHVVEGRYDETRIAKVSMHTVLRELRFSCLSPKRRESALLCAIDLSLQTDFGDLLHTFVSGGKIPFPGGKDRSERRLGSTAPLIAPEGQASRAAWTTPGEGR